VDVIKKVREKGGDVIVSFGGAAGTELATVTNSVDELFSKYKLVVDKFNLKSVDFDIEGSAIHDIESCDRRGKAIATLKKMYPNLDVTMTVPVMPFGLDADTLACTNMTPHDTLNIMAMDFGREEDMAQAVISAIQATRRQTRKKIAVTVMIGKNDTPEIFTLENARTLKNFLKKNLWVTRVSFWSIQRDQGKDGELAHSSKIKQKKWEFTNILTF
jgi:hypothetical protein